MADGGDKCAVCSTERDNEIHVPDDKVPYTPPDHKGPFRFHHFRKRSRKSDAVDSPVVAGPAAPKYVVGIKADSLEEARKLLSGFDCVHILEMHPEHEVAHWGRYKRMCRTPGCIYTEYHPSPCKLAG